MISAVENKDLPPASTSLNQRLSDIVGELKINFNEKYKIIKQLFIRPKS